MSKVSARQYLHEDHTSVGEPSLCYTDVENEDSLFSIHKHTERTGFRGAFVICHYPRSKLHLCPVSSPMLEYALWMVCVVCRLASY